MGHSQGEQNRSGRRKIARSSELQRRKREGKKAQEKDGHGWQEEEDDKHVMNKKIGG